VANLKKDAEGHSLEALAEELGIKTNSDIA